MLLGATLSKEAIIDLSIYNSVCTDRHNGESRTRFVYFYLQNVAYLAQDTFESKPGFCVNPLFSDRIKHSNVNSVSRLC
jgi:hypothetical protein